MIEAAIVQGLFKIFLAVVGIMAGRATLIWMDRRTGENRFEKFIENADSKSLSLYFSARLLFVAIIIGFAVG